MFHNAAARKAAQNKYKADFKSTVNANSDSKSGHAKLLKIYEEIECFYCMDLK